jgi:anti-sigma-K factor RskA
MDQFEERLRCALKRQSPPSDLAVRVTARAAQRQHASSTWSWRWFPRWRWAVAAALCVALAGGVAYRNERQERIRGEAAKRQVIVALRIASEKIQLAQYKVQHLSDR